MCIEKHKQGVVNLQVKDDLKLWSEDVALKDREKSF